MRRRKRHPDIRDRGHCGLDGEPWEQHPMLKINEDGRHRRRGCSNPAGPWLHDRGGTTPWKQVGHILVKKAAAVFVVPAFTPPRERWLIYRLGLRLESCGYAVGQGRPPMNGAPITSRAAPAWWSPAIMRSAGSKARAGLGWRRGWCAANDTPPGMTPARTGGIASASPRSIPRESGCS